MKISKFDYAMFDKAREVAKKSTYDGYSLGCVIVYKKHIIGEGANSNKSHPRQKKYNRKYRTFLKTEKPINDLGHAEILALCDIPYPIGQNIDWKEIKVYVFRISPGKSLGQGMARPCKACMAALRDKGIRNLYYTTDTGYAYEKIF